MRRLLTLLAAVAALGLAAATYMVALAMSEPVVRRATVIMPDWPADARPMRIVLLSDLHVAGPDMPPSRIARIADRINALKPDMVAIAGDFVSDKRGATKRYPAAPGLAPLARLRARFGAWAVLGNHDHWRDAGEVTRALRRANVRILDNQAVTVGPLRLGGVDDDFTGRADVPATVAAMRAGPGSRVLLTHSPDVAPATPADVSLILAGHTHCGQIRLPLIGAISYESDHGDRYGCGVVVEGARRVVISAGLGTSVLPFRFGAPPDLWVLMLRSR